uniref:Ig-like domain-containing protein n=1 Tax=Sparus aurata TaxID=8175 RepID=A0A671U3K4_SPAAU
SETTCVFSSLVVSCVFESTVKVLVKEGSDAVLPCLISTKEDITGQVFDWKKDESRKEKKEVFIYDAGNHYNNGHTGQDDQFKGRVSFFEDQLQRGNASIKITRTKMADSGNYSCDFPGFELGQPSIIELVVGEHTADYVSLYNEASYYLSVSKLSNMCLFCLSDPVLKDRTNENIPGES